MMNNDTALILLLADRQREIEANDAKNVDWPPFGLLAIGSMLVHGVGFVVCCWMGWWFAAGTCGLGFCVIGYVLRKVNEHNPTRSPR